MKKVAIVGFGGSKNQLQYRDDTEIWGMNDLYSHLEKWSRWFDIHDFDSADPNSIKNHKTNRAKLQKLEAYKKMECPIYCQEAWEEIPTAIKYPLQEIQKELCNGEKGYFTNQVSYMIALAIYEKFDKISLYGIDMAVDDEYEHQRPSVEYWIGYARGKGIEVYVPNDSSLLKTNYIYGYEQEEAIEFVADCKKRLEFLKDRKERAKHAMEKNNESMNQYIGAISDLEHTIKVWGGSGV